MPAVERVALAEPRLSGTEAEVTWSVLEYCRSVLLLKCQGLDDEQLKRRAVAPSNLTLLGLLRHLTKVEHYWFQRCFLALPDGPIYSTAEHVDADFEDLDATPVLEVVARYLATCSASRAVVATHDLGDVAALPREGQVVNLRYIGVHMVDEYSRHLGHADLLREAIDGSVGN
jgi:uncharacterized damage-inducible protein DinB